MKYALDTTGTATTSIVLHLSDLQQMNIGSPYTGPSKASHPRVAHMDSAKNLMRKLNLGEGSIRDTLRHCHGRGLFIWAPENTKQTPRILKRLRNCMRKTVFVCFFLLLYLLHPYLSSIPLTLFLICGRTGAFTVTTPTCLKIPHLLCTLLDAYTLVMSPLHTRSRTWRFSFFALALNLQQAGVQHVREPC